MDSRDTSLSSAATRDGASPDDDAGLSVAASLAKDAALLFQSRKFSECLDVLNQLLQKKEDDPKVFFSLFISLYFCLSVLILFGSFADCFGGLVLSVF